MFALATVIEGILRETLDVEGVSALTFRDVVVEPGAVQDGALFVNLSEERQGDIVAEAVARGATGVILEREVALRERGSRLDLRRSPPTLPNELETPVWLIVDDAEAALEKLAGHWRGQHAVKVMLAMGRGTERPAARMTASVLEQRYEVLSGETDNSSPLTFPLTLLRLQSNHERVILAGNWKAAKLVNVAQPTVVLVTDTGSNDPESHRTFTKQAGQVVKALPADAAVILNGDDPWLTELTDETQAQVVTYGLSSKWDLWASEVESLGVEGTSFWLHRDEEKLRVRIPYFGRPAVHSALAAAAVGAVEGFSLGEAVAGLQALPAQIQVLTTPGPRDSVLIDDSHSASPDSSIAALNLFDELGGRKIAVFGRLTRFEEGEERGYERVGGRAAQVADVVVAIGEAGRRIGEEALLRGKGEEDILFADDNADAVRQLHRLLQAGDQVLIKGAKERGMEGIATALATSPRAEEAG